MKVSAIGSSASFAALIVVACVANKGSFALVNKAKEPIARASVTVCGQTVDLGGIQPGQRALGHYKVKADSHYDVEIEFESGRKLRGAVGYVTNGLDFHHDIVITDADIEIVK